MVYPLQIVSFFFWYKAFAIPLYIHEMSLEQQQHLFYAA